jgi:hypothetical protein
VADGNETAAKVGTWVDAPGGTWRCGCDPVNHDMLGHWSGCGVCHFRRPAATLPGDGASAEARVDEAPEVGRRASGDDLWNCDCAHGYRQHRRDRLSCATCGCARPCPPGVTPAPAKGPAEDAIRAECAWLADFLVEKSRLYNNAALAPVAIASKATPVERILCRIDEKLARWASPQPGDAEDTERDLLGGLLLLRVARKLAKGGAL